MSPVNDVTGTLIEALQRPSAYPAPVGAVEVIETHISVVFLAGDHAYKIKKPVDLGFLDFSTLSRRHRFCEEELRLNRRLAPELYLDVVPVTRGPDGLRFGGDGEALEWAVRMRRFDQAAQLDRQLAAGHLTPEDLDAVAAHIAEFHAAASVAAADAPWGTPAAVRAPVDANFHTLEPALAGTALEPALGRLADWRDRRARALEAVFERRRRDGRVRECHGDLHLRNMARIGDRIVAFDGIEFEPALRWIDVVSDSAFLLMDLCSRGRPDLGWRFMNGWLSGTGDYAGLALLDWYLAYRHLVRAKVDAIRVGQPGVPADERASLRTRIEAHIEQADALREPGRAILLLTHGLSGSGKSWVARRLGASLPAVVLRSDVERKRLLGRASGGSTDALYSTSANDATYERLAALAGDVIGYGYSVIVDATFLGRARRDRFRALADRLGAPCLFLAVTAPPEVLEARVVARAAAGRDPSDAGRSVLASQLARPHAIEPDEEACAVPVDSTREIDAAALAAAIRLRAAGGGSALT
jgi:aminoglycoside phosphotransferase family enzyme/predicted kinase